MEEISGAFVAAEEKKASLGREEETSLWLALSSGSEDAREKLILAYRPLVFWIARQLRVPYQTYPDLIQEGTLALIRAVDHFDIQRKNRFSTYAYYRIRGQMVNFLERVEAKAPLPFDEDAPCPSHEGLSKQGDAEKQIDRMEWSIALVEALDSLPEKEAHVLRSIAMQGARAADVARERGLDVSYVYRIYRSGLSRLKTLLAGVDVS